VARESIGKEVISRMPAKKKAKKGKKH